MHVCSMYIAKVYRNFKTFTFFSVCACYHCLYCCCCCCLLACFVLWIVLIPYQIWYGFAVICWWNWTKNGFTNRRMSADDSPWKHVLFRVAYVFCVLRMSQLVLRIQNSLARSFTCKRLLSVFLFQFCFSLSHTLDSIVRSVANSPIVSRNSIQCTCLMIV